MGKHKQERTSLTTVWEKLKKTWERRNIKIMFLGVGALFIYLVFLAMGPWLDTFDIKEWKCEVISATPHTSSGGLRGSASIALLDVETKDCGPIFVTGKKVNFRNIEDVAASFEPGSEWIFKVGWYETNYKIKIEGNPPTVFDFYKLDSQQHDPK